MGLNIRYRVNDLHDLHVSNRQTIKNCKRVRGLLVFETVGTGAKIWYGFVTGLSTQLLHLVESDKTRAMRDVYKTIVIAQLFEIQDKT